jgi:hypothetical protein
MKLDLQHIESDFVPAAESNYYRHFITISNVDPMFMSLTLTPDQIDDGYDSFILYRFPLIDGAEKTPVAKLTLTNNEGDVTYEITYMNQEPLPDYDLPLVTQGDLYVIEGLVDMQFIVFVDQLRVALVDDGSFDNYYYDDEGEFDPSKIYYWTRCGYVMELEDDDDWGTNSVEVPLAPGVTLFTLGNYTYADLDKDEFKPTILAGMKNANIDCFSLAEEPEVTGYTILRGDNTYPTDTISYVVRPGAERVYIEQSNALPEYFGQEETWQIERNDTSLMVLGDYGDYMTYVPVTRTNGADRVKQDGENTYGYLAQKTGVAGLDVIVDGFVHDQNSSEPFMFKDEDGVDCAIFDTHFDISIMLPDYASMEYEAEWLSIWVKSDNIRNFYFDTDGNIIYEPKDEDDESGDYQLIWYEMLPNDFSGELSIGDYDMDPCGFGATYEATLEEGVTFVVRLYYEAQPDMPLKGNYPSWMPTHCVVEKQIPWKIEHTVVTGVKEINSEEEVGKTFYNVQGIASDTPYDGFNIVVTRYSDGSTKSKKVIL